ncbi:MAG: hypothetical protein R3212_05615 [Xanthomonadales bacterium]|nr:hypothetical protein [Xanthomonadales bacterium]
MELDQRAESVCERLWLVSNTDGTQEIVKDSERAGRGGFAPAWGQTYREVLRQFVDSLERSALSWLEFHAAYLSGETVTTGPLGGRNMPAVAFVANGHTYTAYIGTHHKGQFLGFGGRLATITMADGKVYQSNNVWSGRDIPPTLRKVLRDNATIKWDAPQPPKEQTP